MLAAYWRGEITLRKLRVLIQYLPEDSPARWQATDGRPFTIRDAMMWRALWAVASVAQGLAGKDNDAFENMPAYPWLVEHSLDGKDTAAKMTALRTLGVPYTDEDIAGARDAVRGKTEMDAMVAYLQVLGTALTNKR